MRNNGTVKWSLMITIPPETLFAHRGYVYGLIESLATATENSDTVSIAVNCTTED